MLIISAGVLFFIRIHICIILSQKLSALFPTGIPYSQTLTKSKTDLESAHNAVLIYVKCLCPVVSFMCTLQINGPVNACTCTCVVD